MVHFIPKQYRHEPVTVRISYQKLERIDRLAADYHISRSQLINQCIDFTLDQIGGEREDVKREEFAGTLP